MARRSGGTLLDDPQTDDHTKGDESTTRRARREGWEAADAPAGPSGIAEAEGRSARSLTRRERRRRTDLRRRIAILVPTLAVLVLGVFLVGRMVRGDGGTTGANAPARPAGGAGTAAGSGALLLEHRAANGQSDLFVVVGRGGGRSQASVLLVPAGTQAEVPSLGMQALGEVPTLGEAGLLNTSIENLLGVRIASTATVDDAALTMALQPAAPIGVDLRHEVRITARGAESIIPAGRQSLSAEDAARLMTATEPGGEVEHLVTVQAVIEGWVSRLRDRAIAKATLSARPDLAALVTGARSGVLVSTLPVNSLASPTGQRFDVRNADLVRYIRRAFPGALLGVNGDRPRVEVLNGTGGVGVTQGASRLVVPAGGHVTLTGNVPGFGVGQTQVVYYRDADKATAQRMLGALGCGGLRRADQPIGVVDVTVIVGADCPGI